MAAKDCQGKLTAEEAACADCVLELSTAQTVKRERVVLRCRCKVPGLCRVPTAQIQLLNTSRDRSAGQTEGHQPNRDAYLFDVVTGADMGNGVVKLV